MRMSIDKAIEIVNHYLDYPQEEVRKALLLAIETMRKYQQLKADYENRLKADMVAMLTELQLEIEECVDGGEGSPQFEQGVTIARVQVVEMIQQKINALNGTISN